MTQINKSIMSYLLKLMKVYLNPTLSKIIISSAYIKQMNIQRSLNLIVTGQLGDQMITSYPWGQLKVELLDKQEFIINLKKSVLTLSQEVYM